MYQKTGLFVTFFVNTCMKCCSWLHEMLFLAVLQQSTRIETTIYALAYCPQCLSLQCLKINRGHNGQRIRL